jgi:hypothetical protein
MVLADGFAWNGQAYESLSDHRHPVERASLLWPEG